MCTSHIYTKIGNWVCQLYLSFQNPSLFGNFASQDTFVQLYWPPIIFVAQKIFLILMEQIHAVVMPEISRLVNSLSLVTMYLHNWLSS